MRHALLPLPITALCAALLACSGERPADIGVHDGTLIPCPDSPNCVSSYATDADHRVAPLDASLADIERVLAERGEARIVLWEANYIHAEFTSRIMRFVDDVEFLYDPALGQTHVRSASRLGHSDIGVNRERIESIRAALE